MCRTAVNATCLVPKHSPKKQRDLGSYFSESHLCYCRIVQGMEMILTWGLPHRLSELWEIQGVGPSGGLDPLSTLASVSRWRAGAAAGLRLTCGKHLVLGLLLNYLPQR